MVASYLEDHSDFYRNFVCGPVLSYDPYNADSDLPSEVDVQIASLSDPETLRALLQWEGYLTRIRNGAWGDDVVIEALSDMFSITINVHRADNRACTVVVRTPTHGDSAFEVNLGLILQYHFVGLDRLNDSTSESHSEPITASCTAEPEHAETSPSPKDTNENASDTELDDATIEQGDEHTRQITGGPTVSMMSLENPEAFAEIMSLAPAEGQTPLSIMTNPKFETMCNPEKFPYGTGCFNSERPSRLTYRKYFNQRLLDVDGRFAKDTDYLFVAQYIVEAKQVLDDANHFIWRQKPGRNVTAHQAKDQSFLSQCLRKDRAYRFMKNIRGSPHITNGRFTSYLP